jgi:addiction module antitoxin, RelB/DinJ family
MLAVFFGNTTSGYPVWTVEFSHIWATMVLRNDATRGSSAMAKQTVVRARVEPELKANVERVLDQLGLSTSQAITLFLKQIELRQGLPFPVELPNRETLKTFRDTDKGKNLKRFNNADELFDDLGI